MYPPLQVNMNPWGIFLWPRWLLHMVIPMIMKPIFLWQSNLYILGKVRVYIVISQSDVVKWYWNDAPRHLSIDVKSNHSIYIPTEAVGLPLLLHDCISYLLHGFAHCLFCDIHWVEEKSIHVWLAITMMQRFVLGWRFNTDGVWITIHSKQKI